MFHKKDDIDKLLFTCVDYAQCCMLGMVAVDWNAEWNGEEMMVHSTKQESPGDYQSASEQMGHSWEYDKKMAIHAVVTSNQELQMIYHSFADEQKMDRNSLVDIQTETDQEFTVLHQKKIEEYTLREIQNSEASLRS